MLRFTIPGKIASDHRPDVVQFRYDKKTGQSIKLAKPIVHLPDEYKKFRERVHFFADRVRISEGWIVPADGVKIKMYLHFYVGTRQMSKPGKRPSHLVYRRCPDHGNMAKCVEDSLQDRHFKKAITWRGLYHNDRDVITLPMPGLESWVTILEGVNEYVDVMLVTE